MNILYLIQHISYELHTVIKQFSQTKQSILPDYAFCGRPDFKDPYFDLSFLESRMSFSMPQSPDELFPVLFCFQEDLYYACVPSPEYLFLIGPLRFSTEIPMKLHILREEISIPRDFHNSVFVCDFDLFVKNVLLCCNLFRNKPVSKDVLLNQNCIRTNLYDEVMQGYSQLIFDIQEDFSPHNSYEQELREFYSIEQGNLDMLKKSWEEDLAGNLGRLAKDDLRNMKNIGIVVITLASRAAIRGGLMPEVAFSMSDVFIQKLEEMKDISALTGLVRQYETIYTQAVADLKHGDHTRIRKNQSTRIEFCKNYVFKHLHEKIRIQDIANEMFLNANYLSEIFHQYEGISLNDFILREKINLVKNLLVYSEYSFISIAAYLGFCSQSHLGKTFKKYTGMTLKQYRSKYGAKSFRKDFS